MQDKSGAITVDKNIAIHWDFPVCTERIIKENKPNIIVKNQDSKIYLLIDLSIPYNYNILAEEFDEISK